MKKIIVVSAFLLLFSTGAFAQDNSGGAGRKLPADYKTDNCTWFPDGDYADCCVEHDTAYFFGGTEKERREADRKLYKCVKAKKGWQHKIIAPIMWLGVRIGGVSWLPTPFRWGFGRKRKSK